MSLLQLVRAFCCCIDFAATSRCLLLLHLRVHTTIVFGQQGCAPDACLCPLISLLVMVVLTLRLLVMVVLTLLLQVPH